jgi:hypothetical protein
MEIIDEDKKNKKFNPWDDNRTFIQDLGDVKSFLTFVDDNKLDTDNTNYISNDFSTNYINMLEELDAISSSHNHKITQLEFLYEKYRNEFILSKNNNYKSCDQILYLIEMFKKIELNKIKITNLLHNVQMSENNIIKLKHSSKPNFMKIIKIVLNKLNNSDNYLDFIDLSLNIHPETINKIVIYFNNFL